MRRLRSLRAKSVRVPAFGSVLAISLGLSAVSSFLPAPVLAQEFSFSNVVVEGNALVDPATIIKFAGIGRGQPLTAAGLNDAFQRISASGLFETVELIPQGGTLIIRVKEYPTINIVNFEGNRRIKDEDLSGIVKSQSRRVYSPATAEQDAAAIAQTYSDAGRLAARVEPRIIRRDGNRVDLVFEIREGRVTEVERLSFTGNRDFSDRRLRQILETKQAGLLRTFVQRDTFVGDRLELDRQLLTDFYRSRGYIDMKVLGVASEFSRERDGFFLTFNVEEGQSYKIARVSTVSDYPGVDAAEYEAQVRVRPGSTYSPTSIENTITRMEGVALRQGVNFVNIEPRFTRNERNGTLDVQFVITKGPRVFVERIDIEGNATTLDQVIRRQFRTVEGDPLSPREIRQAAERIRALGFFANAEVNANQGSSADQVVVDVNVEEQPTGTLSFGVTYGTSAGAGVNVGFTESNFLGRGQFLGVNLSSGIDNSNSSIQFIEPAFLNRDLKFKLSGGYVTSNADNELYDTKSIDFSTGLEFPISEAARLELRYSISKDEMSNYTGSSPIIAAETALGSLLSTGPGYTLTYDTRITGLSPSSNLLLKFGQDYAGVGGDVESVTTSASGTFQTKIFNEEITLRADLEGGAITTLGGGTSRIIDRFSGNGKVRGFEPNGYGPRDTGAASNDALGGNFFAAARFEAQFPVGLPEEYGISAGIFADVGSVWGLDNAGTVDDSLNLRSSVGLSLFWTTPIGPLRFNFSKALQKEVYDQEQSFDLTVSTKF
jgi:outer membrane protein insertion porin family